MNGITRRFATMLAMALAGMAIFAAQAPAQHGNGSRDAEADGASNRCEVQAETDPNVADTDGDTVADGDEDTDGDGASNRAESNLHSDCGRANSHLRIRRATIASFTDGTLVLTVRGGGTVTAPVSDSLRCRAQTKSAKSASSAKHGADDPAGHDQGDDHGKGDDHGSHGHHLSKCTAADLTAGTKVHKAKIRGGKFVEIRLVK